MSTKQQPSTALVVALAVVAVAAIGATALIIVTLDKSELPEGWLALFLGFLGTMVVTVANLSKVEKIARQVDDLANGKMDAKIRAGVADVVKDEHLDPAFTEQIKADRVRRNEEHA